MNCRRGISSSSLPESEFEQNEEAEEQGERGGVGNLVFGVKVDVDDEAGMGASGGSSIFV
jgi:hypothetical protein